MTATAKTAAAGKKRRTVKGRTRGKVKALLAAGVTDRETARQTGVPQGTVRRVREQEQIPRPNAGGRARPAPDAQPDTDALPEVEESEMSREFSTVAVSMHEELERMNRQRAKLIALGDSAEKDGNTPVARLAHKDAAAVGNNILRVRQKMHEASGGGVTHTREELELARRKLRDTIDALLQSPECKQGVCPRCGEQIRINWSEGKET